MEQNSILLTIAQLLGIESDYEVYNIDLMIHINSAFWNLYQIGSLPDVGFKITGPNETWGDFKEASKIKNFEAVKEYVYIKTRLVFDPPSTSFVLKAYEDMLKEMEWRISIYCTPE